MGDAFIQTSYMRMGGIAALSVLLGLSPIIYGGIWYLLHRLQRGKRESGETKNKPVTKWKMINMKKIENIALIGLGAVGCAYLTTIAEHLSPEKIRVVAAGERAERYRKMV